MIFLLHQSVMTKMIRPLVGFWIFLLWLSSVFLLNRNYVSRLSIIK